MGWILVVDHRCLTVAAKYAVTRRLHFVRYPLSVMFERVYINLHVQKQYIVVSTPTRLVIFAQLQMKY